MRIYILAVALLAGCATAKPTYGPDGSAAHSLDCSGTARNWGMCYEKAGELCKERGYEILAGGTDAITTAAATRDGFYGGSGFTRNLVIKCK